MADDVTQEPDGFKQHEDQVETPEPPAPGGGDDSPTEQPDAIRETAEKWDTGQDKPGGHNENQR